jgi:4-amino-4-deoxy-L-arabinose transferase-like glycosyltransferase
MQLTSRAKPPQALDVSTTTRGIYRAWAITLVLITAALALINLPYAPRTWFDEGSHLHVPKTLLTDGLYADKSATADGGVEYRYHGPTIGIGPTIMLPVAAAFQFFGVDLLVARLVMVGYLLLAFGALYALARRLHGPTVALLATTLLLASRTFSYEGAVEQGRQVLGEVPGTAFVLLGMLAWAAAVRAEGRQAWRPALLAGLGFGMALVTKNQFVLIVPAALFFAALLDWRYYRVGGWVVRIVPLVVACGCFVIWQLIQYQFLGPGTFSENIAQTRQAAGGAIFVFNLRSTLRAGYYILRPDLLGGLIVPALAYTMWRARRRDAAGLIESLFALIIGLWLAWYVGVSLGWPRYAFPAVMLSTIPIARAVHDLIVRLWKSNGRRRALAVVAGAYLALAIVVPLGLTARTLAVRDDSAQRFAAYIDANVPQDALIATWEQELAVLTDHPYIYPPQQLLDRAVRREWLGGDPVSYDWYSAAPQYVAIGDFGSYTGVYATPELEQQYREAARIGTYVLYERMP